jgi:hypothetical protein
VEMDHCAKRLVQQPLAQQLGALRLSDGRVRSNWFPSRFWFQADVRAERVKRTLGGTRENPEG